LKKVALITGITGQDGSYLAEFLISKGYQVHGLIRKASLIKTDRIDHLFNHKSLHLHYGDVTDDQSIFRIISLIRPYEIYNLAAQSHVKVSFELPLYTANVDALGTLRILEAVKSLGLSTRIYQASTSELYGQLRTNKAINENTPFNPVSPYAVAKLYSYEIIKTYRMAYGMFASNGILFNHESPRRGETFVTRKITIGIKNYLKNGKHFELGNLYSKRDWGHAKDYAIGMWKILQYKRPDDFILSTNKAVSIKKFLEICLKMSKIKYEFIYEKKSKKILKIIDKRNMKTIVRINEKYLRPNEVPYLKGDYSKAKKLLNWKPKIDLKSLIKDMLSSENS
tara:strand:- start:1664 stop:2680 length:1017 start_codon:yes stop_codon:yes gene_type:complete